MAVFRFSVSHGTLSTTVRSGSLLGFPRDQEIAVPWSVPAFLLRMPGGAPPLRRISLRDRHLPQYETRHPLLAGMEERRKDR
jgi:hypothetical protein